MAQQFMSTVAAPIRYKRVSLGRKVKHKLVETRAWTFGPPTWADRETTKKLLCIPLLPTASILDNEAQSPRTRNLQPLPVRLPSPPVHPDQGTAQYRYYTIPKMPQPPREYIHGIGPPALTLIYRDSLERATSMTDRIVLNTTHMRAPSTSTTSSRSTPTHSTPGSPTRPRSPETPISPPSPPSPSPEVPIPYTPPTTPQQATYTGPPLLWPTTLHPTPTSTFLWVPASPGYTGPPGPPEPPAHTPPDSGSKHSDNSRPPTPNIPAVPSGSSRVYGRVYGQGGFCPQHPNYPYPLCPHCPRHATDLRPQPQPSPPT